MDSFKLCAAAFLAAVAAVLVRQYRQDIALPIRTAASLVLLTGAVVLLTPTLRWLEALGEGIFAAAHAATVGRALAIVFLVRICGGLCRDLGEPGIASALELVGRAELLLLAIPLFDELLAAAARLTTW